MAEQQAKLESGMPPALAPIAAKPSDDAVVLKKDDSKSLVVSKESKIPVPERKITSTKSLDRDVALAELTKEKQLSCVKAWEDHEKSKIDHRAEKHLSAVAAWEEKKKASLFALLKKQEEELERKKALCIEKMKNKVALVHKEAEEKRATVQAKRGEELIMVEEMAQKYRATGTTPKKTIIGCF